MLPGMGHYRLWLERLQHEAIGEIATERDCHRLIFRPLNAQRERLIALGAQKTLILHRQAFFLIGR